MRREEESFKDSSECKTTKKVSFDYQTKDVFSSSRKNLFFRLKTTIWYASLITIVQEIIQGTDNDCLLAVVTAGDRSSANIFLISLFVWSPAVGKKLSQKLKPSSKYIWVQPISLIGADWGQFGARLSRKSSVKGCLHFAEEAATTFKSWFEIPV